jgi:hypothetical protein
VEIAFLPLTLKVGEDAINGDQPFGNGLRGSEIEAFLLFFDMRRALRKAGNGSPTPTPKCFTVSESFRNSPFILSG